MWAIFCERRDIVWADSISIVKLAGLFGHTLKYRPGTFVVAEALKEGHLFDQGFFLTAHTLQGVPEARQFTLPIIAEGREHQLSDDLLKAVRSLVPGSTVAIGVSSPKQNRIAVALHSLRPDLTYHCLGAALSLIDQSAADPAALEYSRSGREWTRFLREAPARTLGKLRITLLEIARILFMPKSRQEFRQFIQTCRSENRG